MTWYTFIEQYIKQKERSAYKADVLATGMLTVLSPEECALVSCLYNTQNVQFVIEHLGIDESTYYRRLDRIRRKLEPFLVENGLLKSSSGERVKLAQEGDMILYP